MQQAHDLALVVDHVPAAEMIAWVLIMRSCSLGNFMVDLL